MTYTQWLWKYNEALIKQTVKDRLLQWPSNYSTSCLVGNQQKMYEQRNGMHIFIVSHDCPTFRLI